jgi:hypothetical protein
VRRLAVAALAALWPLLAAAQTQAVAPAPTVVPMQSAPDRPDQITPAAPAPVVATAPSAPASQGAPAPAAPAAPAAPSGPLTPEPPPMTWVSKTQATVAVLDKVSARTATATIKVGASANFGPLTVAVGACAVRAPDEPADSAAWLDITDSHPGQPAFHGWMLANEPSMSMLEHPIYDVRVLACAG